ncbi:MAG: ABC transporter substrate-binding protein [Rubrivivax sp.]
MKAIKLGTLAATLIGLLGSVPAQAQVSDDVVRIGVISDMTGPYAAAAGMGLVRAAEMAVKDLGGSVLGKPIEVVWANHQGKVDIAVAKAREWYDAEKVDIILEAADSASAIAIGKLAAARKKPVIYVGSGSTALTGKECTPYSIQWTYNTYALAASTVRAIVERGGKSWYLITVDYALGQAMERDAQSVMKAAGATLAGISRHPLNAPDFSSLVLQAQASKAQVVAIGNAGQDTQNAIRQAVEFGLMKNQIVTALLIFDNDIKGLGLNLAQGLLFTTAFHWDRTPETRAFAKRFAEIQKAGPSQVQAGGYSAASHYLKAVAAAKTDAGDAVMEQMRKTPVNDFFAQNGRIREDGQHIHDLYLAEVKKPSESTSDWDVARVIRTVPAESAFRPLSESECPLVKR